MEKLRIAQIATLFEPVTDSSTNGLTQIVYVLTEELVALGHDVTVYAPLQSSTKAKLVPLSGLTHGSETILGKVWPVAAAFADWRNFDIIHDHTRFYSTSLRTCFPFLGLNSSPPIEFDELHWHHPAEDYAAFFQASWERLLKV
jgi:hypothetical protein